MKTMFCFSFNRIRVQDDRLLIFDRRSSRCNAGPSFILNILVR